MIDLKELIEQSTQIPTADTAFSKPQSLPFVVFLDRTDGDGDDFNTRLIEHDLAVEFYAERIDKTNEAKLEVLFEKQQWKVHKERTWLPDEKMFETIYQMKFTERVNENERI